MPDAAGPVVVAMDATPLLGNRTGVGASVAGFLNAVATDPRLDVIGFGLPALGREGPSGTSP